MAANPLQETAVEAIELDSFTKQIPDLVQHSKTLYSLFKNNSTVIPVANVTAAGGVTRPSFRVPLRIQAGAGLSQGTGNGDSLGRGTGSSWVGFALSPVFVYNVCEITFLSRIATEGRKRGLFNVQAQELKNTFTQATQGIESLVQGNGTGILDTIPTTATVTIGPPGSIVGLNNAFQFTDQQTIQVFNPTGPALRGSFTISFVDTVANAIYSTGALPAGTTTGDYLVINGATAAAGDSILGLQAWQVNGNTGTIAGLNRADYPGRLSTPVIDLQGSSVTPSTGNRCQALLTRALGVDNPGIKKAVWYTGEDQALQISSLMYNVQIVNAQEVKGDNAFDVARKYWPDTFAGRALHVGANALPGRWDLIDLDFWYMGELLPLELYDFGGGITVAPVPDITNGGYLTSSQFAYVCAFNIVNSNPRAGAYIKNAAIPPI